MNALVRISSKQTYTNKFFDYALVAITLLFSLDGVLALFGEVGYLSNYFIKVCLAAVSVMACLSLFVNQLNGERYSRYFVIIVLILVPLFVFGQYLADLGFYGINRTDLLQHPFVYVKLISGIALLILSIRFSSEDSAARVKDYGILTMLIGTFSLILVVIRTMEPDGINFNDPAFMMGFEFFVKFAVSLLIIFLGYRLMRQKITWKTCTILCVILAFLYGVF
jgi:hypothetical protein